MVDGTNVGRIPKLFYCELKKNEQIKKMQETDNTHVHTL